MVKVCVLRSGGDFRPEHVQRLASQVPGLVCLSDVDVPGVECIPLQTKWPGWWAKMEVYGPSLSGDVLYFDLDTVVIGNIPTPDRTTVLRDFYRPDLIGSGFMYLSEEDRAHVWERFNEDPAAHMLMCSRWPLWGDQGFLGRVLKDPQRWQDFAPGAVVSYKVHCQKSVPSGAKVVCFHGKPRPWEIGEKWLRL